MGRSIRILVANRPKLMRELILATLSDEPGIEIVGEVSDEAEIRQRVRQTSPEFEKYKQAITALVGSLQNSLEPG